MKNQLISTLSSTIKKQIDFLNNTKKPFYKRLWFIIIVGSIALSIIIQTVNPIEQNPQNEIQNQAEIIEYEVVTSEDLESNKIHTYRIIVSPEATKEQLMAIYQELNDTKYDELTLWFYSSQESVDGGAYDVAIIERATQDSEATIKMK